MTGKEAILDQILSDAKAIVNSTLEEANSVSANILEVAQNDAVIYRQKKMEESYSEREEIIRRRITVANLEVKKLLLQAKQNLIDRAFTEAVEAVKKDADRYKELIKAMLRYADDGDKITVAVADKKVITKAFLEKCAKEYGKELTVNDDYGDFSGGIILSAEGSDKNFTLEVELKSIREESEPEIAQILFGA